MTPRRPVVLIVLAAGVLAVSSAALLVRLTDSPALTTAAARMVLASVPALALLPLRGRRELAACGRDDGWRLVLSGCCLGLHFATWIASLQLTTVSSSVALVTTSPLFVAAYLWRAGKPVSRATVTAMLLCLCGGMVIGHADLLRGSGAIEGDLLALAGSMFAAAYFALGSSVRPKTSITTYIGVVYPVAALLLVLLTLATRQRIGGLGAATYAMYTLMALVPQLIGHSSLNWSLGYLSAPFVTIAILGEPVIATGQAALFLGEQPGLERIAGGALLLAGVYLGLRAELRAGSAGASTPLLANA